MSKESYNRTEEDEYGPSYKQAKMFLQFSKIEDSQGNPKPLTSVLTDDNKRVRVTLVQAKKMKALEQTIVKPFDKQKFADSIQYEKGLRAWLKSPILDML
jgi:hypothetical protein